MKKFFRNLSFRFRKFLLVRQIRKDMIERALQKNPNSGELEFMKEVATDAGVFLISTIKKTMADYQDLVSQILRAPQVTPDDLTNLARLLGENKAGLLAPQGKIKSTPGFDEVVADALQQYDDLISRLQTRAEAIKSFRP
ncbi:MAG: hypothetical protein JWP09_102 [Candidatus Taylorbacteria bacterium]|nr:hypothetical protein [Candidatus Taylorbacteria bacterium]